MLAIRVTYFLALMHILLKFYPTVFNKFGKCIAVVMNDMIDQLQMGVSAILQSCVRTFSMHHYLSLCKVF